MKPAGSSLVSFADVLEAQARIHPHVHCTPIVTSQTLDMTLGARLFFKCENFQRTGSFKVRGAFNAVFFMKPEEVEHGVVTSSSGNQAAALSLAAGIRGTRAYVSMPRAAVQPKVAAVRRYGGEIVWVDSKEAIPTSDEYEAATAQIQRETGAVLVHPYNDPRTIAGQATCAVEFLKAVPDLDLILTPLGGGGLLAGTALASKSIKPSIRLVGCEPEGASDGKQSLLAGHIVPQLSACTIADGLRTSLGSVTFPLIKSYVDDIVTASEQGLINAMRLTWEVLKIVIEPSSAVPLATLLESRIACAGKNIGIILTGGNADLNKLPWLSGL